MIKIPHATMWHICVIRGFSILFLIFFRLQSSMVQVTFIDLILVFIFYLISSSFTWMSFWIEIKPCDIRLAGLFFSILSLVMFLLFRNWQLKPCIHTSHKFQCKWFYLFVIEWIPFLSVDFLQPRSSLIFWNNLLVWQHPIEKLKL